MKYVTFPARSVAMILIFAKVLSVFGKTNTYDPSFAVSVVILVVLTKFVMEYSNKSGVAQ